MEDYEERFIAETQEEAHYWWTVKEFAVLTLNNNLATMLQDVLEYRLQLIKKEKPSG
jgi:hypothetical protein